MKLWMQFFLVSAVSAVGGFMLALFLMGLEQGPAAPSARRKAPAPREAPAREPSAPAASSAPAAAEPLPAEQDLPVDLEAGPSSQGLLLAARVSRIARYGESSFYTLHGVLTNDGTNELKKIRLRFRALDGHGKVLAADAVEALGTHQAIVRPKDRHFFDLLQKVPAEMVRAQLVVELVEQDLAPLQYPPSPPLELAWPLETPSQPPIEVRERQAITSPNSFSEGVFVDTTLEVSNASTGALRSLKLEQRYFGAADALLKKEQFLVLFSSTASLLPGETRLIRRMEQLPEGYSRYSLAVLEIH